VNISLSVQHLRNQRLAVGGIRDDIVPLDLMLNSRPSSLNPSPDVFLDRGAYRNAFLDEIRRITERCARRPEGRPWLRIVAKPESPGGAWTEQRLEICESEARLAYRGCAGISVDVLESQAYLVALKRLDLDDAPLRLLIRGRLKRFWKTHFRAIAREPQLVDEPVNLNRRYFPDSAPEFARVRCEGIDDLAPEEFKVVSLLAEGFKQADIAVMFGRDQATVSRILARARKKLRLTA